jgi:hypothetical protein
MQFAVALRPTDPTMHYNTACTYCALGMKAEALEALKQAWKFGYRDSVWVRRDPDLTILHDEPEFDQLYPEQPVAG